MKKNLFYLFALICSVSLFTACSDNDDDATSALLNKVNGVYASETLDLDYSGSSMTGKQVSFQSNDGVTAVISMTGAPLAGLGQIGGLDLKNPGVIPGEATTVLNVNLVAEGDGFTFKGVEKKENYTINYDGSVKEGLLDIDLEVEMAANELVGTWNLQVSDFFEGTSPFTIVWKAEQKFQISLFPGMTVPQDPEFLVGTLLKTVPLIPVGTGKKTAEDALMLLFKDVTFQKDGNIVATYSEKDNMADPQWKSSPVNMAQYAVKGNKLMLYLNADEVMKIVMAPKTKAFDPSSVMISMLPELLKFAPMLSAGIPLNYEIVDGKLVVFIDKELGMQLVNVVMPLFQNPEFIAFLKDKIAQNPDMSAMAPMISSVLEQVKDVLPTTTEMKIGLNFAK